MLVIAMQAVAIAPPSVQIIEQIHNSSRGDNVSEIQSLKSVIQDQKTAIGHWNNTAIGFVTLAFFAAGGLVLTSFVLKHKNKSLEDTQDNLASLIENQNAADREEFRLSLAKINQQAEEARDRAAQATLELAKFKTPRNLTSAQQARIVAKAVRFRGTTFDVAASNSKEPLDLVTMIEEALTKAGWKELIEYRII